MKTISSSMRDRRILGITFDDRPIFEPANAGSSITFAAAGGGKTTCVSVPAIQSLLARTSPRALFVNDVKNGEIAAQIADMCIRHGRKFGVVDEFEVLGPNYPHRIRLNALGPALEAVREDRDGDLPFIIENMVHALIEEPKDDAKNFYWRESPRALIELALRLLIVNYPNMAFPGGLRALLSDPHGWSRNLDLEIQDGKEPLCSAARQVLELKTNNPEHYSQHMGAALSALKVFGFGPLERAGQSPDLTHAGLIRGKWVVCFVNPVRFADRLGPFFALHFLALMNAQLSGGAGKADYILDEFCNAPLRDALNRVTIQRAFQARSHFIAQSRSDIVRRYGEKETALLEENCTIKQWLKFSNFEEAERVSKAIGEATSVNAGLGTSSDRSSLSQNYSTAKERLFTADELMRLPPDEQILHVADVGFIHCRKIRQNQIAPFCFELGDNPLEGGRLPPDPKITIPID
jgi:type IV secretion system protein VirD4